jgi:hypothetical protein
MEPLSSDRDLVLQGNISLGFDVSTTTGLNFSGTAQTYFHPNGALIPNNAGTNYIGLFSRDSSDSILLGPATSSGKANGPLTLTSTSVGIGTSSPGALLDLTATAGAGGQTSVIRFGLGAAAESYIGVANAAGNIIANSAQGDTVIRNDGGKILFSTDSGTTAHAVIDSSGRLGIGTTSPGDKLDVFGIVRATNTTDSNFYSTFSNPDGLTRIRAYGGGSSICFDLGTSEKARIDSSGRLLVGTSSTRTWGALRVNFCLKVQASARHHSLFQTQTINMDAS